MNGTSEVDNCFFLVLFTRKNVLLQLCEHTHTLNWKRSLETLSGDWTMAGYKGPGKVLCRYRCNPGKGKWYTARSEQTHCYTHQVTIRVSS